MAIPRNWSLYRKSSVALVISSRLEVIASAVTFDREWIVVGSRRAFMMAYLESWRRLFIWGRIAFQSST